MSRDDMERVKRLRDRQDIVFTAIQLYENIEITGAIHTGKSYFMTKISNHYHDCAIFCMYSDDSKALIPSVSSHYEFLGDNYRNRPIIPLHPELSLQSNLDLLNQYSLKPLYRDQWMNQEYEEKDCTYTFNGLLKKTPMIIISNHVSSVSYNPITCSKLNQFNHERISRLDELLKDVCNKPDEPFGGIQVVFFNHHPRELTSDSSLLKHLSLTPVLSK